MSKRRTLAAGVAAVLGLFGAFGAFGCGPKAPTLQPDDVISAQVSTYPMSPLHTMDLRADYPKQRAAIAKVIQWLDAAQPAKDQSNDTMYQSTLLEITLKNGVSFAVRPAYNCTYGKNATANKQADDSSKACHPAKGQVQVFDDKEQRYRLNAPELYDWLMGGYKQDVNR